MPEFITHFFDENNEESIYCTNAGSGWKDFIELIKLSVANRNGGETPLAKVNSDQSVSIFLQQCESWNIQKICKEFIIKHLEFHCERLEFPLIGKAKSILTIIEGDKVSGINQYRFNISPYHFDTLLKLNNAYGGYDTENNLLKLVRDEFSLKPGVISLFPALAMNPQENIIRAAGCQISEMISVQLYKLFFPEKKGPGKAFHWMPPEVKERLNISGDELVMIIKKLLIKQKLLAKIGSNSDAINFSPQEADGLDFIIMTPSVDNPIKINKLDANALDFYALYGNCGAIELQQDGYRSVEVGTLHFLNYLKEYLQNKFKRYGKEPYYANNQFSLKDSIKLLEKLIEIEKERSAFKFNRDIKDFEGAMILFDAAHSNSQADNISISDQIYTVGQNASKNPDLVANIGSRVAIDTALLDRRFDIVCINYAPSKSINLQNVFEAAQRVLNDEGVLLFINAETKNREPVSKISLFGYLFDGTKKVKVNTPLYFLSMVTTAGFKSAKPLARYNEEADGSILIATKSDSPIDVKEICAMVPALKNILKSNNVNVELYMEECIPQFS